MDGLASPPGGIRVRIGDRNRVRVTDRNMIRGGGFDDDSGGIVAMMVMGTIMIMIMATLSYDYGYDYAGGLVLAIGTHMLLPTSTHSLIRIRMRM